MLGAAPMAALAEEMIVASFLEFLLCGFMFQTKGSKMSVAIVVGLVVANMLLRFAVLYAAVYVCTAAVARALSGVLGWT